MDNFDNKLASLPSIQQIEEQEKNQGYELKWFEKIIHNNTCFGFAMLCVLAIIATI